MFDAHNASAGYHHIGGVRINCNSRHSFISATVAMYYSNGSRWVQYGSSAYGVKHNVTGSGYGAGGILDTPAYCLPGPGHIALAFGRARDGCRGPVTAAKR